MLAAFLDLAGLSCSRCFHKYRSGICEKDKAVKRGEIIMINDRRVCQWDQTSVSLECAVFSLYPCFSVSLLFTGECFVLIRVRINL